MSQLAQALVALDGQVGLVAQDGNFLGLMSSDINHPNSIINPNTYGNPHGNTIYNQCSLYGGEGGLYSPDNPLCLNPPILMDANEQHLALVTRNYNIVTNGLNIIDPLFMLGILYGLAYQQSNISEQFANTYAIREQEIAADLSRRLGNSYSEAARTQAQSFAAITNAVMSRRPAY